MDKVFEQGGRCIVSIGSWPFDLGSQPVNQHIRDVMKPFQRRFDDFLPGVIGDRLYGEGVDSTDDSLNTFTCDFENFVNMLCLNGSKRLR